MKIQDCFLLCLIIHSLWICGSEFQDVKKERRTVSFSAESKSKDGGPKPKMFLSNRIKYLDYPANVKNDDFDLDSAEVTPYKDLDVKDCHEERPETDEDSSEFKEDCPFSLLPEGHADRKNHGQCQCREEQRNLKASISKLRREHRVRRIVLFNIWEQQNTRQNIQSCNNFDYQLQQQAEARCKRLLEHLHIDEK